MLVQVKISEKCYLKDPDTTDLGKRIIESSIKLIDEIGFEAFTFKKLAKRIESTEASVYRYFENKHKLLIYLVSWYWNWVEYRLQFDMHNIKNPQQRLEIFIDSITRPIKMDDTFLHVDEVALHRIVISESSKAYLTKEVDMDNKEGYFVSFKRLVGQIVEQIRTINPNYPYPAALVSTIIESAHNQKYFSDHLPSLSETQSEGDLSGFLKDLLFKSIVPTNGNS
jgi:AcrR family transcriptional regulator